MAVQYDSKNDTWSTWVTMLKDEIPSASKEAKKTFEDIQKKINEGFVLDSYDDYIKQNKLADESLIKFLTDANYGTKDLANYQEYLKQSSGGMTTFAKATKKAGTVLKSFGAALASMAINWVIGEVIGLITNVIDNIINASKKAKEAAKEAQEEYKKLTSEIESINKELKTTQDRIKELKGLGSLTLVEQDELKKLERQNAELERQKFLKEEMAKSAAKEAAKKSKEAYEKSKGTYGRYDSDANYTTIDPSQGFLVDTLWHKEVYGSDAHRLNWLSGQLESNDRELKELYDKLNNETPGSELYNEIYEKIRSKEAYISKVETKLQDIYNDIKEYYDGFFYEDGTIVEGYEDVANFIIQAFDRYSIALSKRNNTTGEHNTIEFKAFISTDDKELEEQIQEITDKINNDEEISADNYPLLKEELKKLPLALEDGESAWEVFIAYLRESKKKAEEGSSANEVFAQSVKSINDSLKKLADKASILSSVNQEIAKTGQISADNLAKINEAFPEDKYPEMTEALYEYQLGLIDEQTLFEQLEKCYKEDQADYISTLKEKQLESSSFYDKLKGDNKGFFERLSKAYGEDLDAWTSVAKAKMGIEAKLYEQLNKIWGDYTDRWKGWFDEEGNYHPTISTIESAEGAMDDRIGDYERALYELGYNTNRQNIKSAEDYIKEFNKIVKSYKPNTDYDFLSGNGNSSQFSDMFDWIEIAVSRLEREISNLDTVVGNTYKSWTDRNKELAKEIGKVTEEINLQKDAASKYLSLANSVALSETDKAAIRAGKIDVEKITDEARKTQIDDYKNFYEKYLEASDKITELETKFNNLNTSVKFDNINAEFEAIQNQLSYTANMIDKTITLAETKGQFASQKAYEQLINNSKSILSSLYAQRDKLADTLNEAIKNGLKENTQAWDDMKSQINGVNEKIIDTINEIEELGNKLRELDYSKFEYMQDEISKLNSEANFYINLIEKIGEKLIDDTGALTNEGKTTIGLHSQNYETYLNLANQYSDKVKEINEQIANAPTNKDLIAKKQEYIEAQRESILAAEDEKKAIKELIKESYNAQIDSLTKLIGKYKEMMSETRDSADFEKNVSNQVKELAKLQKQYDAFSGDNSEESKKLRQQLEVSIKDAQEELQQTEYEKMVSDTERLLDNVQTEYEEFINDKMNNINSSIDNIVQALIGSDSIKAVLDELSTDSKLPLSEEMEAVWKSDNPISSLDTTVSTIPEAISGTTQAIGEIKDKLQDILDKMDEDFEKVQDNQDTPSNTPNTTPTTPTVPPSTNNSGTSGNNGNNGDTNVSTDGWWIYKKSYYDKNKLNINTSIVDRLAWHDYDPSFEARAKYYSRMGGTGTYTSSYDQNVWMLNWMKKNGYKAGTVNAKKGIHLFDEEGLGSEIIITKNGVLKQFQGGEHVFNKDMVDKLWTMAQNPFSMAQNFKMPKVSSNVKNNVSYECGDVSFVFPNVENYEDFMKKAQSDSRFEKMVQEMSWGQAMGNNSFKKKTF